MNLRTPHPLITAGAGFAAGALLTFGLADVIARRAQHTPHDDVLLLEQVRSRLHSLVSYPEAIDVTVAQGIVHVSGRVLAEELNGLLLRLTDLPGVYKVHNALTVVEEPRALENLQAPGAISPV